MFEFMCKKSVVVWSMMNVVADVVVVLLKLLCRPALAPPVSQSLAAASSRGHSSVYSAARDDQLEHSNPDTLICSAEGHNQDLKISRMDEKTW